MTTTRREFVLGVAGLAACAGSGTGGTPSADTDTASTACTLPTSGTAQPYCLLSPLRVRVPGAAGLKVGEAVLANVDDSTAVIVARDANGLYALSAVCTHACCVVALCTDAACGTLTPSPDACAQSDVVTPDPTSGIVCPCHGSSFRLSDGAVLTGPAKTPLPAYAVAVQGADAWVDTGAVVDSASRS